MFLLVMTMVYITSSFLSCSKDDDSSNNNSTEICQAILDEDQTAMVDLMEELMMDLTPTSTATDQLGHEANYNKLIVRLNNFSCMEASGICYACLRTLPEQSIIKVVVDLDGVQVERSLSISTPKYGVLLLL